MLPIPAPLTSKAQKHDRQDLRETFVIEASNILADIPEHLPEELFQTLLATDTLRIERIVSRGHCSPDGFWYDQDRQEWVLLIQGAARLRFEGEDQVVEMTPGSFINIPAHKRHRVEWTEPAVPTVWLAVHYPSV
jgi:cupin 2 domain-containing protein